MMSLSEKLVANRQRRNLMQLRKKIDKINLRHAVVNQIYYPQSGQILSAVLKNMFDGLWPKTTYFSSSLDWEGHLSQHLAPISSAEETVLCFFPNYTVHIDDVVSDLPVLEVLGKTIDEWYKLARGDGLHFFLCTSKDLRKGVVLDIYEADPVVHHAAGAVMDLYSWCM